MRHIKSVEGVQRRVTKLVKGLKDLSYRERLMALELPKLEYRRKRGDMILVYKILNENIDCDSSIFFILNTSKTRGHGFKIFKKQSRLQVRKKVFTQRIVNDWNRIPREVVNSSSIVQFEKSYDDFHKGVKYDFIKIGIFK